MKNDGTQNPILNELALFSQWPTECLQQSLHCGWIPGYITDTKVVSACVFVIASAEWHLPIQVIKLLGVCSHLIATHPNNSPLV